MVVPVEFDGFQMTCIGENRFALGSVTGTADFSITASANPLDIDFGFVSDNYSMLPPSNSTVLSCVAALTTQNAVVSNLVTTNVPEALEGTLQDLIDSLIGDVIQTQGSERKYPLPERNRTGLFVVSVLTARLPLFLVLCSELETGTPEAFNPFVKQLSDPLLPFLAPRSPVDPLSAERNYNAPDGILDLTTQERTPVDWFLGILSSPFLDNIFINELVAALLDDEGKAVILAEAFGDGGPAQLDLDFADVNVTFVAANIFGLDSFTFFGEREFYGKYTFGAPFRLEFVYTEIDLVVDILPKDSDGIDFAEPVVITENITVTSNATGVEGFFALFLAIKTDELAKLPPLTFDLDCLLPTFDGLEVTQLQTTMNLSDPMLSGFSSPGTGRLAQGWTDSFWLKYEDSLMLAMPNIMQEVFRPLLNTEALIPLVDSADECNCAATHSGENSINCVGEKIQNGNGGYPNYGQAVGNVMEYSNGYGQTLDNVLGFSPGGD